MTQVVSSEVVANMNPEIAETPISMQALADKAAIDASGTIHLRAIYQDKVNNSHAKVANIVAQIMAQAERAVNWTFEETKVIWDKVESEI